MASNRDLRSYFVKTDNTNKETSSSNQKGSLVIQSSLNITGEIQYVQQEIKKQIAKPAKRYDNIPSKIKQEIGNYALIHGTKAVIDRFLNVYTKYSLTITTINGQKEGGVVFTGGREMNIFSMVFRYFGNSMVGKRYFNH